ncbi:cytosolic Fe-S cluster assembly factor NUBP2 homolog [Dendroctonus ponderosae]|uniref:Cytosolic Fe-S cluster assembly factor NUBP2 homolog n=1 Tax=Dendroctonus ponderosae TaxID=77166 RepID=J3JVV5_DENPD
MLDGVKHIILVLSGKGGVGKSTVSTQLALTLVERGFRVGVLDVDLCGPSVPYLLQLEGKAVHNADGGWIPVFADDSQNLAVISIGFLQNDRNTAVIWRGPKKTAMIKQFFTDVRWGERDYLIIDTPPGTSDEHITVMENLKTIKCDGAVIVTTPQEMSIEDVRKEITFCRKTGIPILGLIENMSGFVCPHCTECTNIFSKGGGESLAQLSKIPFLGSLPIDPRVGEMLGIACIKQLPNSPAALVFSQIVDKVCK